MVSILVRRDQFNITPQGIVHIGTAPPMEGDAVIEPGVGAGAAIRRDKQSF